MKIVHRLILVFILTFVLSYAVAAHSGGTDSNGGHMDNSTGIYHYHHGYPAHQHEDLDGDGVLDCPYEFVDKTGENSGTSSGTKNQKLEDPQQTGKNEGVSEKKSETESFFMYIIIGLLVLPVLCPFIIGIVLGIEKGVGNAREAIRNRKYKSSREYALEMKRQREEAQKLAEKIKSDTTDLLCRYKKVQSALQANGFKSPYEIAKVPPGIEVDLNFLPHTAGKTPENDDIYYFSTSSNGTYHKISCRYADVSKVQNVMKIRQCGRRSRPCSLCKPILPDVTWIPDLKKARNDIFDMSDFYSFDLHFNP